MQFVSAQPQPWGELILEVKKIPNLVHLSLFIRHHSSTLWIHIRIHFFEIVRWMTIGPFPLNLVTQVVQEQGQYMLSDWSARTEC